MHTFGNTLFTSIGTFICIYNGGLLFLQAEITLIY